MYATARAPIARVKLLLQVAPEVNPSIPPRVNFPKSWYVTSKAIVSKDGWLGFWRGNWCMIAQHICFNVVDAGVNRYFSGFMRFVRNLGGNSIIVGITRGLGKSAIRAILSTALFFPLDVIRTRKQTELKPSKTEPRRSEGTGEKRRLYSGFWSSVMSCLAYKISYDCCFAITETNNKNFWVRHLVRTYVCTAVAKSVAYPFLTISRRQMVAIKGKYRGDLHAVQKIVKEEGVWTLWRGFGLNFVGTLLATIATVSLKFGSLSSSDAS